MRILLTGSTGFTGLHFEAHATMLGHQILPLNADLTNANAVTKAVTESLPIDAVVHLAAISFVGHANDLDFYAVNTVGTTHLLAALAALPVADRPSKVLITSSANVYGNSQFSPIPETQTPAPVNHYGASKLAMEHMALSYLDRLPVVITRSFNYTGRGQATSFLIPKLVDHYARRASSVELGNIQVKREFNDIRMVIDVYMRLLNFGISGEIYNVCSGTTYSLKSVMNLLTKMTGYAPEVRINPALIRDNEVLRLCGDPQKLCNCIGELPVYSLIDCLSLMLDSTFTQNT